MTENMPEAHTCVKGIIPKDKAIKSDKKVKIYDAIIETVKDISSRAYARNDVAHSPIIFSGNIGGDLEAKIFGDTNSPKARLHDKKDLFQLLAYSNYWTAEVNFYLRHLLYCLDYGDLRAPPLPKKPRLPPIEQFLRNKPQKKHKESPPQPLKPPA
jgi:hypothetical protein